MIIDLLKHFAGYQNIGQYFQEKMTFLKKNQNRHLLLDHNKTPLSLNLMIFVKSKFKNRSIKENYVSGTVLVTILCEKPSLKSKLVSNFTSRATSNLN